MADNQEDKWTERSNVSEVANGQSGASMFRLLFERSSDPSWLLDPETGRFFDCNQATVALMRAGTKERLLQHTPVDLSPPYQADGRSSEEVAREIIARVERTGGERFEWLARRCDGEEVPLEVVSTLIEAGARRLHYVVSRDITEAKAREAEIRQWNLSLEKRIAERTAELSASQARLLTLLEHAPEAIVVFDGTTGRFDLVNQNAVRLFGRTQKELLQMTPEDVSPPLQPDGRTSREVSREKITLALAGETPIFDWTHRHSSGRLFTNEVRLVRLPAEGRQLLRASIIDTSARRRRERIQAATYGISEAIHTTEDLGQLYERIHGIVKDLMPAGNFYIALRLPDSDWFEFPYFLDERDSPPAPRRLGEGLTSHVFQTGKALLVNPDTHIARVGGGRATLTAEDAHTSYFEVGSPAAVWLGVPLNSHGQTIGVMAVQDYHDPLAYGQEEKLLLTFVAEQTALAIERKQAQQALRESEHKFRALFMASGQGVMLHDEKRFIEVNPAALRIMGYDSAEEILGKHPRDTSPPFQPNGVSSAEMSQRYIEECLKKGSARFEWVALTRGGAEVPLEVILTAIPMGGRRIIQAVIHDISDRKKAESELLKALAREKELSALKSNFVSLVSHEFRTPLGIILSSSEILGDYLEELDSEERRHHLLSIQRNTRRMADLMEEVLLLGRLDAGRMEFRPEPIDLPALCRRWVDEVLSATEARCPIELDLVQAPAQFQGDQRLLEHIFINLLTNAVKYSEFGSPVRFVVEIVGTELVCRVEDRGIGIPEADTAFLFKAFQRGSNVGNRPGTGLGLVVVRRCVELHHGRIEVCSPPDGGTTMKVRFPLMSPPPPALAPPSAS